MNTCTRSSVSMENSKWWISLSIGVLVAFPRASLMLYIAIVKMPRKLKKLLMGLKSMEMLSSVILLLLRDDELLPCVILILDDISLEGDRFLEEVVAIPEGARVQFVGDHPSGEVPLLSAALVLQEGGDH